MTTDPSKRRRRAAWALLFLAPLPASAMVADPFAAMTPLAQTTLEDARGGMMIGGLQADFAVTVRTTVQQAVSQGLQPIIGLETRLAINDNGAISGATTTPIGFTASSAPPSAAGPATSTPDVQFATSGAANSADATISLAAGAATRIIQQVSNSQLQTLVDNAANGVTVSNSTTLDVNLRNFQQKSQYFAQQYQAARMGVEASLAGLRH